MSERPITRDIVDVLEIFNVGTFGTSAGASSGWPIFIGSEPEQPNDCITLYDTPGEPPNPKWLLDFPRFMARVRSHSYEQGFAKAGELKGALLGLPSQDINGIRYVGIYVVMDTYFLQADDKGRSIFVNTWRVIREPTEGEHRQPL